MMSDQASDIAAVGAGTTIAIATTTIEPCTRRRLGIADL
jgi:hypothetical protein